jgi:hypothetical protein
MLKLIPVIEFSPVYFQKQEHKMPNAPANQLPEEWSIYWKKCLADSGITNIDAYQENSWLIEITKLNPEVVRILLIKRYELGDGFIDPIDRLFDLEGGYILEVSEKVKILPECCGSIKDINDWESASNWLNSDETSLWIGHPELMISSIDDWYLQIRRTPPYSALEEDECRIIIVDRYELKAAIIDAKKQLDDFKQLLFIALPSIFPHLLNDLPSPTATEIAEVLIYGW